MERELKDSNEIQALIEASNKKLQQASENKPKGKGKGTEAAASK